MRTITIAILLILSISSAYAASQPSLAEQFKHPGPDYRPVPFFSLNDDLRADELTWQIKEMRSHGYGGAFLHARVGRITPYMSEEWLNLIAHSVKESKAAGNYAWLYDEDRWPSGFAGGIVPAMGMEYRAKSVDLQEFDVSADTRVETKDGQLVINGFTDIIALFSCKKTGSTLTNIRRLPVKTDVGLPSGAHILLFRKNIPRNGEPRFNGFSYIDTLEPKVVKAFIDSTYEPYYKKLSTSCGKEIPGIFTDEPELSAMAWTERLPDAFEKRYGYDLLDFLPSLYYEVGDWQRIQHDYRSLTCDLFVEAYSKQLYEWCDKHKLQFTGHYMAEDNLVSQLQRAGACMPHYEYEHQPGIDHLFRKLGEVSLIKQVSSAANQLGRKRVLSETFGGGGWNMSLADQRSIANWQLALGVNFMNPHLCHYSLRGARKRDWPASLYFQQPYWKYYGRMNDYLARACTMLSRGDFVADVLVIHPISSAWCTWSPRDASQAEPINRQFTTVSNLLVELQREFEYGDEKLMAKYAKVDGKDLVVGKMRYKVVVIPPAVTLSGSTFKLLQEFMDNGGHVIAIQPTPTRLNGAESPKVKEFFARKTPNLAVIIDTRSSLENALTSASPAGVSVKSSLGLPQSRIVIHRRQDGKRQTIFLANSNLTEDYTATLTVDKIGKVEEWNLETGSVSAAPARREGSGTAIDLRIPGGGAKLYVIDESVPLKPLDAHIPTRTMDRELPDAWRVQRRSQNALVMDRCRYRIGQGEWKEAVPVYRVQQEMEKQPDGTQVSLSFTFDVGFQPSGGPIYLVTEQPQVHTVIVNGKAIRYEDAGWWVDKSFRKLNIAGAVKSGENTVELTCKFINPKKPGTLQFVKNGVELEAIYLVGEFAVEAAETRSDGPAGTTVAEGPFRLVRDNPVPVIGDLTAAGYPFFVGDIEVYQEVDVPFMPEGRAYLEFDGLNAMTARVYVNGEDAGLVYWRPYRVDVTPYLEKGSNRIQVVLTNSLHNLLGPLHHKDGERTVASPGSFTDGRNWADSYHLVKLGISGKARIVWED